MLIEFTKNTWLNTRLYKVARIDIDADADVNFDNAVYYVKITFEDGTEEQSDYFKTLEEARACAEDFIRALIEGEDDDND